MSKIEQGINENVNKNSNDKFLNEFFLLEIYSKYI
jgi:hypothetical protein